jgi:NAD(P)-dependent dehydrogenase (short-subunit alcohol dehydrogenase family)
LKLIQLDVTDDSSVKGAVEKIVSEKGRIDILVNNAGYGLFGAFEDLLMDEIKAQFETNFFGVIRVTQHVLPSMRNDIGGYQRHIIFKRHLCLLQVLSVLL